MGRSRSTVDTPLGCRCQRQARLLRRQIRSGLGWMSAAAGQAPRHARRCRLKTNSRQMSWLGGRRRCRPYMTCLAAHQRRRPQRPRRSGQRSKQQAVVCRPRQSAACPQGIAPLQHQRQRQQQQRSAAPSLLGSLWQACFLGPACHPASTQPPSHAGSVAPGPVQWLSRLPRRHSRTKPAWSSSQVPGSSWDGSMPTAGLRAWGLRAAAAGCR